MRYLPNVLLVLSLPAGFIGYAVGVQVISGMSLPKQLQDVLVVFAPLFLAALFMMPFAIPFFDRKAKQDLAAYRASQGGTTDDPGEDEGGTGRPTTRG